MKKQIVSLSALMLSIIFFAGCDWFSGNSLKKSQDSASMSSGSMANKSTDNDEILLYVNDKPRIRVSDFQDYYNELLEAQPQLKQIIAFMPDAKKDIFNGLVNEEAIKTYIEKNNIKDRKDYKDDLQKIMKLAERQLAVKYFQQERPVTISETEIKKFYEDNKKTMPELLISAGGVNAVGVAFDKEADAQAFLTKVQAPKANFAQLAKESKLTVKEFKNINAQSFEVDPVVREKLVSLKKFPSTELIKGKAKIWVVQATNKAEAQYKPYEEVKSGIEMMLKQERLFTKELETLKKDYNFVENKEYFEREKKASEPANLPEPTQAPEGKMTKSSPVKGA